MANPGRKRATYGDVLKAPRHVIAELVDGELVASPRPGGPHTMAATALTGLLVPPFQFGSGGPGGWIVMFEPELHLGRDILVPDLAAWRRTRMPHVGAGAYFALPPDWLCECVSRSTGAIDRKVKLPIYARAGVRNVWMVDALQRTLEVLRLDDGAWRSIASHHGDARVRAEPFADVELEVGALWADTLLPALRGSRCEEEQAPWGAPR